MTEVDFRGTQPTGADLGNLAVRAHRQAQSLDLRGVAIGDAVLRI